ncbi:MAG: DinB family protein [Bacteroidota bacterium]|nr:DinB family protein [Bacteroidota bacterium]
MNYTIDDGFPYYIELVGKEDYKHLFESKTLYDLLQPISESKANYRYASGKWSIKQVLGHVTDHERIMMYRILRFSRKDTTPLPGYDQNVMVDNSRFDEISVADLLTDFNNVRQSSLSFIKMLSNVQMQLTGKAWKYELTVEEFLKATIGHELHHVQVLREKYLI